MVGREDIAPLITQVKLNSMIKLGAISRRFCGTARYGLIELRNIQYGPRNIDIRPYSYSRLSNYNERFMLVGPKPCAFFCFVLIHYVRNQHVSIGQFLSTE